MNFLRFFPMPRYLRIYPAAVDISDRTIKYLQFKSVGSSVSLETFGEERMEDGIIEGGVIKKRELLIQHLKEVRKKIGNNYVTASLPEEKAFLKTVKLPLMDEGQIRKSLEMQLEEIIPMPVSEASFDTELIQTDKDKNTILVLLTAFPRNLIDDYAFSFMEAGFSPVSFELENQAISRALVGFSEQEAVVVVDFGRTRTSFLISDGGTVKFTSTILIAGDSIDKSLARSLKKNISEAEKIKKEPGVFSRRQGEFAELILPVVSTIKDEITKTIIYWGSHAEEHGSKNQEIKKIILCGGDANLDGFTDYLSYELKKPVELGNPWLNVFSLDDYVPAMDRRDSLAYVTAIGLAVNYLK